jgi:hypothetical protein
MINGAGEMKSWFAWHGRSVDKNLRLSSLTPCDPSKVTPAPVPS